MAHSGPCMHGTATLWVSLTSAAKEVVAAKCGPWERVLLVDDDPDVGALVSLALGQLRVTRWRYAARRSMRSSAPDPSGPTSSPGCHDAGKGVPEAMGDGRHSQAFRSGPPSRNAERDLQRAADQSSVPEGFRRPPRCLPERAPREKRCHGSGWHEPTVESLMHMAHGLAGSSALDRVDGLARAAGILEAMLKRLLEAPRWPPSRPPEQVATLVKALARSVRPCPPARASAPTGPSSMPGASSTTSTRSGMRVSWRGGSTPCRPSAKDSMGAGGRSETGHPSAIRPPSRSA
jgi:hypothetical protein